MSFLDKIFSPGKEVSEVAVGTAKGLSDIVHSWVNTSKDKQELEAKIQEVLLTHDEKLKEIAQKEVEIYLKDVDSARNREIQISTSEKAPWLSKTILPILTYMVTLGFFGLLFYMLKYDIPDKNKDVLNIMLGSLGTAWITTIAYFFGSSQSSASKEKTINNLVKK